MMQFQTIQHIEVPPFVKVRRTFSTIVVGISADVDTNQRNRSIHKVVGVCQVFALPHQTQQVIVNFTATHDDLMSSVCHNRNGFSREDEVVLG